MNDCPRQNPAYRPAPTFIAHKSLVRDFPRAHQTGWYLLPLSSPALRATLNQEPAFSGPRRLGSCPIGSRFSSLKIAPGGTLHSADKWGNKYHPARCAANVSMWQPHRTRQVAFCSVNFEAPSRQAARGRLARMANRGHPVSGMYCMAGPVKAA